MTAGTEPSMGCATTSGQSGSAENMENLQEFQILALGYSHLLRGFFQQAGKARPVLAINVRPWSDQFHPGHTGSSTSPFFRSFPALPSFFFSFINRTCCFYANKNQEKVRLFPVIPNLPSVGILPVGS